MKNHQKIIFALLFCPLVIWLHRRKNLRRHQVHSKQMKLLFLLKALGVFEAVDLEEVRSYSANQFIGYVDSVQLFLKRDSCEANNSGWLGRNQIYPTQLSSSRSNSFKNLRIWKQIVSTKSGQSPILPPQNNDDCNAQVAMIEATACSAEVQILTSRLEESPTWATPRKCQIGRS